MSRVDVAGVLRAGVSAFLATVLTACGQVKSSPVLLSDAASDDASPADAASGDASPVDAAHDGTSPADANPGEIMVTVTPTGHGTIISTPAGINCGSTCSASFPAGTRVILTATPDAGATFAGWSGSCSGTDTCTAMVTTSVGATFGCSPGIQTFAYTGAPQVFSHASCVSQIIVNARGAQGGTFNSNFPGGKGGAVQATLAISPTDVITLYVGGAGMKPVTAMSSAAGGYNGGADAPANGCGGGGASDIRFNGTTLLNRVVVAGGGGGGSAGGTGFAGGAGGGLIGSAGGGGDVVAGGGTQTSGGAAAQSGNCTSGLPGVLGSGGAGSSSCGVLGASGGGGGYYGGGGGAAGTGGGGSSFTNETATSVTHTQGAQAGNGSVTITW
jgi:hypothetical protein